MSGVFGLPYLQKKIGEHAWSNRYGCLTLHILAAHSMEYALCLISQMHTTMRVANASYDKGSAESYSRMHRPITNQTKMKEMLVPFAGVLQV